MNVVPRPAPRAENSGMRPCMRDGMKHSPGPWAIVAGVLVNGACDVKSTTKWRPTHENH